MKHPFEMFYAHFGLEYRPAMEDLLLRSESQEMVAAVSHVLLPDSEHPYLILGFTPFDKIDDLWFDFFNDLFALQAVPTVANCYGLVYRDKYETFLCSDWGGLATHLAREGREVTIAQIARLAAQVHGDQLFAGCYVKV